jgi:hypothetical protein
LYRARDFSAKVGKESILKPTTGNERYKTANGVRIVNVATSKNLTVKSTVFPQCNIHIFPSASPDGKIHNKVDHILIDRRWLHVEKFNLRKVYKVESKVQHCVEV